MDLDPVEAPKTFFGLNCDRLTFNDAALNTLFNHFWFVLLKQHKINIQCIIAKTR